MTADLGPQGAAASSDRSAAVRTAAARRRRPALLRSAVSGVTFPLTGHNRKHSASSEVPHRPQRGVLGARQAMLTAGIIALGGGMGGSVRRADAFIDVSDSVPLSRAGL